MGDGGVHAQGGKQKPGEHHEERARPDRGCQANALSLGLGCRIFFATGAGTGHQQPRRAAGNGDSQADDEECQPPFHCLDQRRRDGRHDQGANADSRDGDTGGEAATAVEPFLDRTGSRNIGHSDADPDAYGKGGLHLPQGLGEACNNEADTYQGCTPGNKGARTQPVRQCSGDRSNDEQRQDRQRKCCGDGSARSTEGILQRSEKSPEGIDAPETKGQDEKRPGDYVPAPAGLN